MKKVILNTDIQHPIGSLYFNIYNTNPHNLFGGTWERIAKGKVLVGVDEDDKDFNESQKIGGEKEHTLTIDEMPKHEHGQYIDRYGGRTPLTASNGGGSNIAGYYTGGSWNEYTGPHIMSGSTGEDKSHNNLQPYFTCYIWVRVS